MDIADKISKVSVDKPGDRPKTPVQMVKVTVSE